MNKQIHLFTTLCLSLVLVAALFVAVYPAQATIGTLTGFLTSSEGLSSPTHIWRSSTGTLYIVNIGSGVNGKRITIHNESGTVVDAISVPANITGLAVDSANNKLYISTGSTVVRYDGMDSNAVSSTVVTGLSTPRGLALNADASKLYVANPGASNVKVYSTADWSLLESLTWSGAKIPYPTAVTVDSDENIYVVDNRGTNIAAVTGTARIMKFTAGNSTAEAFVANLVDSANANTADSPSGVALDAAGNVYVLVAGTRAGGSGSIRKYDSSGNFIEMMRPSSPTLNRPSLGIFVTSDYRIYVSNTSASTVVYFDQAIDTPTNFTASSTGANVHLSWNHIADTRLASFLLRRSTVDYPSSISDGVAVTSTSNTSFTDSGLSDGTYYYSIFSRDNVGNYSSAATTSLSINATAPSAPSDFEITADENDLLLSWTNPMDSDFDHVVVRSSTDTFPTSTTDGTLVTSTAATSVTIDDLADGLYYYSIFAVDTSSNVSAAATSSIRIDSVVPTITLVGSATVSQRRGVTYTDAGATATDDVDGTITGSINVSGTVDTSAPGTYTLTYTVTDAHGNEAIPVTRTVTITAPSGGSHAVVRRPKPTTPTPQPQPTQSSPPTPTPSQPTEPAPVTNPTPSTPPTPTQPIPSATPLLSATFSRVLRQGSNGNDVKALQQFLNTRGFIVSQTGPGSLGNETTYFGPATLRALNTFQAAYATQILTPLGLSRPTGIFGEATKKVLLDIL